MPVQEWNPDFIESWNSKHVVQQQRELANTQLKEMKKGNLCRPYSVFLELFNSIVFKNAKVLEVGCASGYYYEVINYNSDIDINYTGIDLSEEMILMAKEYYPDAAFKVDNGLELSFDSEAFDIVFSGAVMEHNPEYEKMFKEIVRTASKYIILHRAWLSESDSAIKTENGYDGQTYYRVTNNIQAFEKMIRKENLLIKKKLSFEEHMLPSESYHFSYLLEKI